MREAVKTAIQECSLGRAAAIAPSTVEPHYFELG